MTFLEYIEAVKSDLIEVIGRGEYDYCIDGAEDVDESAELVYDAAWIDDAVTGNGSGSYTFSAAQAVANVGELLFDPDFVVECAELCIDLGELLKSGPEAIDVTARCLALSPALCDDDVQAAIEAALERVGAAA